MFSLTLKGLWAHKVRYLLTGLAVVLGVAFMAGTMVLTDTMEATFDEVIASANEGTDVIVRSDSVVEGAFASARGRLDAAVVDDVAAVDGVAVARGSIQGTAQLVHADGEAAAADDGLNVTIGANWIDDERLNPFSLSDGRAPESADEAVVDQRTADAEGWTVGDEIQVLTKEGPATLTLVGTAAYGDVDGLPGTTLVATDDATAQRLFAEADRFDMVVVAAEGGVSSTELAERLSATVGAAGSGLEVVTGEQDTADQQDQLAEDLGFFNSFLMAFAYVALFVGTFIIYNTFSIVVAQRLKDLALLRAIGARRAQVLRSVVLESVAVGVVAAGLGLLAGVGLSFALRALLAGVGLDIPSGPLVVASGTVVTALVVGVGVSVLSAIVPAVRASKVRPIAALRDVAIDRSNASVGRTVAGTLLTALGVVAFAAGMVAGGTDGLPVLGLGAGTILVGVITLGPVLVRPAMAVLGAPAARLSGITGRYAKENARRAPKRTAATASALMIGVALVGFITIVAASTKESVAAAVDGSFRADYVVDSGSFTGGFGVDIEEDLLASSAVELISPVRDTPAEVDGVGSQLTAVDTAVFDELYDLELSSGALDRVGDDGVAISSDMATDEGLAVGDTVSVRFADGADVALEVRAIFDGYLPSAYSDWVVDVATFDAHVADVYDRQVFVGVADGVPAAESRAAVEAAVAEWPNAQIDDQAELKETVTAEIDQMLNLIYGLLALAVVIALIGIANTLALSVHERTRELGLLRAIGMHRRQVRAAVRWESVLIAVLAATLGAGLAIGGAWGMVRALAEEQVTHLVLPVPQLLVIMAAAGVAGVVAATGPARRAAKLDILGAIATQ
ncbi:ABC transporter permease [Actinomarinicola tropica]|uniref:FtsX-like permease family protein n=1 Tax=Actinomarinicola tropica TaxID=2789776 RepID=A0A5Q2RKK5_9ACTN|nr:ABC transporter permease [Actinomarinicola tropica]QGG94390.1 FtsX-like permease family protein [Actinomarinicola tropica]